MDRIKDINKFAPHFCGSVKTEYTAHKKTQWERTHTISVSVVTKIGKKVKDFIVGLSRDRVAEVTVHGMMSVMKCFFAIIYELCVNVSLSLTDLDIGNVGVENENDQNFVVILHAETAKLTPQTVGKWQRLITAKATKVVNVFFTDFEIQACAASFEARWQFLCSTIHDEIYTSWFKQFHAIPSPEYI